MLDFLFLTAIGHPARLQTLALVEQRPQSGADLVEPIGVTAWKIARHLGMLEHVGLIEFTPASPTGPERWKATAIGWIALVDALRPFAPGENPYDPGLLDALSHPVRIETLRLLDRTPAAARLVAEYTEVTPTRLRYHLRALAAAGLIRATGQQDNPAAAVLWKTTRQGWNAVVDQLEALTPPNRR